MRIIINKGIKKLFIQIITCLIISTIILLFLINEKYTFIADYMTIWIVIVMFCNVLCIGTFAFLYFRKQDKIMEDAVKQLDIFLAGDDSARISCNKEGEMYHLFSKVNNIGAVLSAHAQNEMREKESLKNTISDISHQLKTPLAALSVYNGLLHDEDDIETVHELADNSEKEIDRINVLVQNLLKITKLDAKTIVFDKREENMLEILKDIELHFAYRAKQEKKSILLNSNVSETESKIMLCCDRAWITEAIENVLKNAFDHTKEGDTIEVSLEKTGSNGIKLAVSDNGSGIHEEDIYYIFKRFYRSRYSQDTQGLGLGLPLAKAIIEEHGGTIEVDSEYGNGTTFVISFFK